MGIIKDKRGKRTKLELQFEGLWEALGDDSYELEPQFKFPKPERQWRFDYAYVPGRIVIEIEGGVWTGGGHTRGSGFTRDTLKYNRATLRGWRILRFTGDMLKRDPLYVIQSIESLIHLVEDEQNNGRNTAKDEHPA